MVRNYKRKTERGKTPISKFEDAYNDMLAYKMTQKAAAEKHNLNEMTLSKSRLSFKISF